MNYHPEQMYVWDAWTMVRDDEAHVYHLQRQRPGCSLDGHVQDMLGHAVSTDLVDWQECPPCFGPDPDNPIDNNQPWTGSAIWHEKKAYLFYTMRGLHAESGLQHIGLATSDDGSTWRRYSRNPVITPDPEWYATTERPVPGVLDCRDLNVIAAPDRSGWIGFYATRCPGKELPETSVIACVQSPDLIHWEHLPPAFAPGKYACIEVPDVFEQDGRWYMTCLTGNQYGNRGIFSEPHLTIGTIFAVSDRPEGPYHELDDNVLIAAHTPNSPISCRSLMFQGRRYVLYTDRETIDHTDHGKVTDGVLSTPKEARTDGDRLFLAFSPRIETHVTQEVIGPRTPPRRANDERVWGQPWQMHSSVWSFGSSVQGQSRTGWGVAELGVKAESFIFEADIRIDSGIAAGLAIRMDSGCGTVVALDAQSGQVSYVELPGAACTEHRRTDVSTGTSIHLRIVQRGPFMEIYTNDELKLCFTRYRGIRGEVGLFIDRADADFANIRLRKLRL